VIAHASVAPRVDVIADHCPGLESRVVVGGERPNWTSYAAGLERSGIRKIRNGPIQVPTKRLEFVNALPKTSTGKIRRDQLREAESNPE
jgi:acyl-coenzyme A synthetase/AMP-(fatty) acid ligase